MMGIPASPDVLRTIQEEHRMHRDIVQGSFMESYRNLTLKAVMALKWVTTYCSNAKYVIKVGYPIIFSKCLAHETHPNLLKSLDHQP